MMRWGDPVPAAIWRRAGNEHPQREKPALVALAWARKRPTWFALDESRPLIAFAGIWTPWTGVRGTKANPVEGEHRLFGFLTTEANDIVRRIHVPRRCRCC